ncbi:tRAP transporter DctM subunit [Roseburia sp. CAG:50]|nr:tRAP transporter DctM subunit [Roseburia sp. CAG:50]
MLIAIVVFVIALIIGAPLAIALGLFGVAHIATMGDATFFNLCVQRMFGGVNIISLSCIPFFMLAGELMNGGGVTTRLLDLLRSILGHVKGGLAYCTVVISAILAAILGSAQGEASLLCRVLVPELKKDGYSEDFSGALISAAAVLGPVIPPSTMFVFYCMLTDVSIKYMFIAGIVPGILLAVAYCIVVAYKAKKMGLNGTGVKPELKKIGKAFVKAIPALCVPLIIIVGITAGIFTATESGAVACVAAMVAGLVYRELDIKKLPQMLFRAAISTGAIFLIVAFGNIIAWSMAKDGIPGLIMTALTSLTSNKYLIILIILVLLVLIGCVLDMASATLVFLPVLFPLATSIGMDGVHFGIIFSIMISIGLITPPVGQVLFVTSNVGKIDFNKIVKQIWVFVIAALAVTAAMAYLPNVVLWIPRLLGYGG